MKITSYSVYLGICFCLSASSGALVAAIFGKTYSSFPDAKKGFYAKNLHKKKDVDGAANWFEKKGYRDEFETYHEVKEFLEKKGHLKQTGQYAFAHDGEKVNQNVMHDVMIALFMSDLVYNLGKLRARTRDLGFSKSELKREVTVGDSFDPRQFSPDQIEVAKLYAGSKGEKFDPTSPMVMLLSGNLKVSKDINAKTPEVKMAQIEDVLKHKDYQIKRFASELTVTAIQSFKKNKLFVYKFDGKYNKQNLVYSIAGRERKDSQHLDEKETDLILAFRGSVTNQDWLQNLQAPLVDVLLRFDEKSKKCFLIEQMTLQKIEIEKALYDKFTEIVEETGEQISIHQGFLGYLFADRGHTGLVDEDKDDDSMYTNIRINLRRLLQQKSMVTNKVFVTGHSLGGALCTIASFFLACDKEINNRSPDWRGISCISFASPAVGNISFQRAFQVLQSKKGYQSTTAKKGDRLLQNIRIVNSRDIVPLVPFFSQYRTVPGAFIQLRRPSLLSLWYPRGPKIKADTVHWKSTRDIWKPWRIIHPTSLMNGFFAVTVPFLAFVASTLPLLFGLFYLIAKLFKSWWPPITDFEQTWIINIVRGFRIWKWDLWKKSFFKFFIDNRTGCGIVGLVLSYLYVLYVFLKKRAGVFARAFTIFFLIPRLWSFTHSIPVGTANFLITIAVAQVVVIFTRGALEVMKIKTHFLTNYYTHLRPHHPLLSSSKAVIDKVSKDLEE